MGVEDATCVSKEIFVNVIKDSLRAIWRGGGDGVGAEKAPIVINFSKKM